MEARTYSATTFCTSDTMLGKMHKRCRTRCKYHRRSKKERRRTVGKRVAIWEKALQDGQALRPQRHTYQQVKGWCGDSAVHPVKCRWVKFKWEVVKCQQVQWSGLKCSEVLRNRVSIIIRRYTHHMKFYCFFYILSVLLCFIVYMVVFCMLLFNFVYYVFLLLCMFRSRYCVSSCCLFYVLFVCKCVLYYCHRVSTRLQLMNI